MRRTRRLLAAAAITLTQVAPGLAQAEDLVVDGAAYNFSIWGTTSGWATYPLVFDGLVQSFTHSDAGGVTRLTTHGESQQDLGGGQWLLHFSAETDTEFFSATGETGYVNIGWSDQGNQALPLLLPVAVQSAVLSFKHGASEVVASAEFGQYAAAPWDGNFTYGLFHGFDNVGAKGVDQITLDITLAAVPEPASLALMLGGAAALALRRCRPSPHGQDC